jgi:3-deoxy-D-arabino-heptulosonate 7-phosphate (DAHP) synthase
MLFGTAIKKMKNGLRVAREGWNGKNMFIYYVPAAKYPASGNALNTMAGVYEDDLVPYQAYIAMRTVDGTVVPWLASQSDILSEDWVEVK